MISKDIQKLIIVTEGFIAASDPAREFAHNIRNLTGMLRASNISEVETILPANLVTNGGAIASIIANKVANCGRK